MPVAHPVLNPGDPAPWFTVASSVNPKFSFSSVGGRYVVMLFFGSAKSETTANALRTVAARWDLFDDVKVAFFGVSIDRHDQTEKRAEQILPTGRFLWDFDLSVSRLYGAIGGIASDAKQVNYRPFWLVLDPSLRVIARAPLEQGEPLMTLISRLPPTHMYAGIEAPAPVLILPRVFERDFCRHLIGLYEQNGGEDSGFMREVNGKTVAIVDHAHKRRADYVIEDPKIHAATRGRILRRVVPEIQKVFQFKVTRMERYIVACYDGKTGGHFRAHRDNTTSGTAHRRFAVTINLNAEEYEGGDLSFPEFGSRRYKVPTGAAIVFSCSLLHEVNPVTRGSRFAFLPFLYDEAAAKIRETNNQFLGEGIGTYKASPAPEKVN